MARTNLSHPAGFVPLNAKPSDVINLTVASSYATALYPGEPVLAVSDGTVARTRGGSAAGVATDGITAVITRIVQYKDPAGYVRRNMKYLPASTTWTAHAERSIVQVVLATDNMRFRTRADGGVASIAAARSLSFANADHAYGGSPDTGLGLTDCILDISTATTTNTLQWRIIEWIDVAQNDPTVVNFTVDVIPNLIMGLPTVGGSLTGL